MKRATVRTSDPIPVYVMDAHYRSFEREVLPELVKHKTAVLGMKTLGNGVLLKSKTVTPTECMHYALNLPTSMVMTGVRGHDRYR